MSLYLWGGYGRLRRLQGGREDPSCLQRHHAVHEFHSSSSRSSGDCCGSAVGNRGTTGEFIEMLLLWCSPVSVFISQ